MPVIPLSENQKQKLSELVSSDQDLISRRAKLILAYAEGLPTMDSALAAGISRGRARYWKRQFLARGMEIFISEPDNSITNELQPKKVDLPDADLLASMDLIHVEVKGKSEVTEIAFPLVKKSIGIKPDDKLADAGKKVWLYHFAIMLSHEEGTLVGENVEELHDMRVATRRMRSAFDIFAEAFEPKQMSRFNKGLRAIGRALGQVRDMDVILENGIRYQQKIADEERVGLEPLLSSWKKEILSKREKLIRHLQSEGYQRFKLEFNRFLQPVENAEEKNIPGNVTTSRVSDIVPVLVYNRYAKVRAYDSILPTSTIGQLHELRIEFKKFRYTLEYFKEILGEQTGGLINEIKLYQDHLGELHDADVACQLVRGYLKGCEEDQGLVPILDRVNPEPVVTYLANLHADRYKLMTTFPVLWKKFNRPEFRQNMAKAISAL